MTTIYLSSTYEDLMEHRRVVIDTLRKSGYHAIAMEDYVATDRRPVEECLRDIDEKTQIYVGIFAFRCWFTFLTFWNTFAIASIQKITTIGRVCRLPSWSSATLKREGPALPGICLEGRTTLES